MLVWLWSLSHTSKYIFITLLERVILRYFALILDKNSLPKDRKRKKQERYAMQRLFSRGQEKVNMQLSDGMKVIYIH